MEFTRHWAGLDLIRITVSQLHTVCQVNCNDNCNLKKFLLLFCEKKTDGNFSGLFIFELFLQKSNKLPPPPPHPCDFCRTWAFQTSCTFFVLQPPPASSHDSKVKPCITKLGISQPLSSFLSLWNQEGIPAAPFAEVRVRVKICACGCGT